MGKYRNQAQRVFDHVKAKLQFPEEVLREKFNISVDKIETDIEKSVKKSGLNGKKVADAMIKLFDEANANVEGSPNE